VSGISQFLRGRTTNLDGHKKSLNFVVDMANFYITEVGFCKSFVKFYELKSFGIFIFICHLSNVARISHGLGLGFDIFRKSRIPLVELVAN